MDIRLKRAYDAPSDSDGLRVLVDRIWPRGVSKDEAQLDAWMKDLAPSDELRTWFDHDPEKWDEFKRRYFGELDDKDGHLAELKEMTGDGRVTLVYGAKDEQHNQAVALKEYLEK